MSGGKGGGTTVSYSSPQLTDEQRAAIAAQTNALTGTFLPTYQNIVKGATDIYNQYAPGYNAAAQNLAGMAGQVQQTAGETGESALRTGTSGLENLFSNDYAQQQLQAALVPAQMQYLQNLAGLNAGFGGAGQLGSARQALAGQQLAGQTQALQQQAAAQVLRDIQSGRLAAGQALAGIGQGGLSQALGAAGTAFGAAGAPQDLYNRYASVAFGAPTASYVPNFAGTQGQTSQTTGSNYRFGFEPPRIPGT